jgi:hypothetical protein
MEKKDGSSRIRGCRCGCPDELKRWAAQTVGIAVCDDFLKKYKACLSGNVPEAQRMIFKGQVDRKMWSDAAKDASSKTTLEDTCKQSGEQMKVSMSSFGCTF